MRAYPVGLLVSAVIGGCTPGVGASGSGGASGSSTSQSSSSPSSSTTQVGATTTTSSTASTGTGGCPTSCADMNPCTDDACVMGACTHTKKAVGSAGNAAEGGCKGVCQADGTCGLQLYERTFPGAGTWSTPQPLSLYWTGQNAPPSHGILSAVHSHADDRLFVFADDGKVYEQKANSWLPPVPTGTRFTGLPPMNVRATYLFQSNAGGPESVTAITIGTTPRQAYNYTLNLDDSLVADSGNPQTIMHPSDANAASQDTLDNDWGFPVQTAYVGTADWVIFYMHYAPNNVPTLYKWNGGSFVWMANWPDAQSPLFMTTTGTGPKPGSVIATYSAGGTVYAIAP